MTPTQKHPEPIPVRPLVEKFRAAAGAVVGIKLGLPVDGIGAGETGLCVCGDLMDKPESAVFAAACDHATTMYITFTSREHVLTPATHSTDAIAKATALLETHWAAVCRIATALIKVDAIDAEGLAKLIAEPITPAKAPKTETKPEPKAELTALVTPKVEAKAA